jgi:hypothetical protein
MYPGKHTTPGGNVGISSKTPLDGRHLPPTSCNKKISLYVLCVCERFICARENGCVTCINVCVYFVLDKENCIHAIHAEIHTKLMIQLQCTTHKIVLS